MRANLALAVTFGVVAVFLGISSDLGAQGTLPSDSTTTTSPSVGTVLTNPPQPRPNPQYVPGFKGTINLDVRNSKPDWTPFTPKKAPPGAPNFLFILYDDTGLAAWSAYGGRINMPTLDRLAANGLTYTQ